MLVTAGIIVLIAVVAGFIGVSLFDALRSGTSAGNTPRGGLHVIALCGHKWRTWRSGTCMTSYSSYGGPDSQEKWTVECCLLCGAKVFHCSGSCDCSVECAAIYEGGVQ